MLKQILSEEFKRMQKLAGLIIENDISDSNFSLSGLRGGFSAVSGTALDIRSDFDIMNMINNEKSFATKFKYKDKNYIVVGLRLTWDAVKKYKIPEPKTMGRDLYSFATIEDTGSLPNNIIDILKNEAVKNISSEKLYGNYILNPKPEDFNPVIINPNMKTK